MDKVIVAYSGGVDSSLLLHVAHKTLNKNVIAVTMDSELLPLEEIKEVQLSLSTVPVEHIILKSDLLSFKKIRSNPPARCYYCKKEIFKKIIKFALSRGITHILEGSNYDDSADYRPGQRALHELNIKSPLKDVMLTKNEIRSILKNMNIPTWNKASAPCLATRFLYGTEITKIKLARIDKAEKYLHEINILNARVRDHGEIARIEIPKDKFNIILKKNAASNIIEKFKALGFSYITLDIEGYRMGSMNEILQRK